MVSVICGNVKHQWITYCWHYGFSNVVVYSHNELWWPLAVNRHSVTSQMLWPLVTKNVGALGHDIDHKMANLAILVIPQIFPHGHKSLDRQRVVAGGHSLTHSVTQSLSHSLTHSLTHPLTHSPSHSLTHSPTHSSTHSYSHYDKKDNQTNK